MNFTLQELHLFNEAAENLYKKSQELLGQNEVAQADLCEGAGDKLKDVIARACAETELKKQQPEFGSKEWFESIEPIPF